MKHLTTEDKVRLEKRLTMENMTDKNIMKLMNELHQYGERGYDPEDLRPFYDRLEEIHLVRNLGYIHLKI